MIYTNKKDVSLLMAVWLLHDEYDGKKGPDEITATGLLKSVKQTVLGSRVPSAGREMDVSDLIASRFGTAMHDSIERAWERSGAEAMQKLGYPPEVAANVRINPTDEEMRASNEIIPIYMERRSFRQIDGFTVSGKFDAVMEGRLFDVKSTSVWTYIKGNKDRDYQLQGSIYRWLNPTLINDEHVWIQFIFTDWQRIEAERAMERSRRTGEPCLYPQSKILEKPIRMLSIQETESWISRKLAKLKQNWDLPESRIPACTDEELWRSPPVYKYFSKPENVKASKVFEDDLAGANQYLAEQGKGIIKTFPGQVRACGYCPASTICAQKELYNEA